jgi:LysR family transcriptional regulator, regulator of gene expression of beta-lactamase
MRLPPLNALRAFEAAARSGSFAAAAKDLRVSSSAISRYVKLLEARLGTPLFQRKPNGLDLTRKGEAFASELSGAFARIAQAADRLKAPAPQSIVLGAGPTLAMRWLIPRLPAFHGQRPGIDVRISTSVEGAGPMRPDWTAAIRMGDGAWPGHTSHFLFTADLFPVCTAAIARKLAAPKDLRKVTLLQAANAKDDWPRWLGAAALENGLLDRALTFDYPAFALQAALDGAGVAMARAPFVADDLAAGRLVRPFGLSVPHGRGWYLIHRPEDADDPALAAFRAWVSGVAQPSRLKRRPRGPSL